MDEPILAIDERNAINSGRWFSTLSPSLRHDILRCTYVKRYKDDELICARGDTADEWIACARVRLLSPSIRARAPNGSPAYGQSKGSAIDKVQLREYFTVFNQQELISELIAEIIR
jgi:hypothetical protein